MLNIRTLWLTVGVACAATPTFSSAAAAQSRVGSDSATRLARYGRDLVYGAAEGLAYAGIDQYGNSPPQWGNGWGGYGKRAASDVGEFVIQESVTEGLAAIMNRPLDYRRCRCRGFGGRVGHALAGVVRDEMPDRTYRLAEPRIVGAFAGSFAQAAWRPTPGSDKTRVALLNGASSFAFGAVINLFHEFVRR